ncbi:hypothetical protein ACN20G_09945 [Streptomyces sp. BI20]|uniref:transmembrane-type terpene cyclase n=1 Tax=Streptomyces sp. BI20 TaxID=3403460 RepID=UPI003C74754E
MDIELALTLVSGIAWTVAYVGILRAGARDRTYGMPLAALVLNLAWESTYAVNEFRHGLSAQGVVNVVWTALDVAILAGWFRHGRAELPAWVGRRLFIAWGVLALAAGYAVQWLFLAHFGTHDATRNSAFLQNLLMSVLFIALYTRREGPRGQSLTVAMAKWLGTLAPTFLFGVIEDSPFILGLGLLCCVFDLLYIALLVRNPALRPAPSNPAPAQ